jgi:hypothetical protein
MSLSKKLITLFERVTSREEFQGQLFSIVISNKGEYEELLPSHRRARLDDKLKQSLLEALHNKKEINGFNITIEIARGCDDYPYDRDWKSSTFTFWSGSDDDEKPSLLPRFNFRRTSDFGEHRTVQFMHRYDEEKNEIYSDYFEWDKVNEKIDLLLELDSQFDEHSKKLIEIHNKLKTEIELVK